MKTDRGNIVPTRYFKLALVKSLGSLADDRGYNPAEFRDDLSAAEEMYRRGASFTTLVDFMSGRVNDRVNRDHETFNSL